MKARYLVVLLMLIGLLLRGLFINGSPPALYGDELTIALDANSLLKTGRDQLGNFLPLTFRMGAGRPAGYVYGTIPFIALFGPSALGVRSLSILSGVGLILLMYLFGKRLFNEEVGLLAASVYTFSPWDISLSRGGFEAHLALFLAVLGTYLLLFAKQKPILFIFSALSFGLTLHTYPTYKLSLLLFIPLLVYFSNLWEKRNNKFLLLAIIIFLILGGFALSQTVIGGSEERFSNINIFSQPKVQSEIVQKIDYERGITGLPGSFAKYFHNKPVEEIKVLLENYLQNFSMDFLVLHGDRNPRQNMATMGEIYLADAVLIFIGLLSFWQNNKKTMVFLLLWILLSPIPTAIVDLPHALRSSFMLPPLLVLSALGLKTLTSQKNKIPLFLITALFLIQFTFFFQKIFFLAPNEYSNFWSYPAKHVSEKVLENRRSFDYVILSDKIDNIEFAYPAYAKVNPRDVIDQNRQRSILAGHEFKKFDNVYIGAVPGDDIFKIMAELNGSLLYVTVASDVAQFRDKNYQIFKGLDGRDAILLFQKS